jgi:hypothetical protein
MGENGDGLIKLVYFLMKRYTRLHPVKELANPSALIVLLRFTSIFKRSWVVVL